MNLERALVTDALDPLGRQLSHELAAHGHSLVLVGQEEGELAQLGADVEAAFNVELRCVAADVRGIDGPAQLFERLANDGLAVDILVHNVRVENHGAFLETTLEQDIGVLRAQLDVSVRLLKLFLGPMAQRQHGRVLNVFPEHPSALGRASGAFLGALGESLVREVGGLGISVSTVRFDPAKFRSTPELEPLARTAYASMMTGESSIQI